MKITDLRCGREFIGEHITNIPGGSVPEDDVLELYLGVKPTDSQYRQHKKPTTHKRAILQHAPGQFYVIPIDKRFYKVEL
jgi:hypothetical protein